MAHTPPDPLNPTTDANRETKRLLFLALFVLGAVAVLHFTPLKQWIDDVQGWKVYVRQFGWWAHVGFIVLSVGAIAVGVPRLLMALAAGALFGSLEGFLVSMFSGLLGSYTTFVTVLRAGPDRFRSFVQANESLRRLLEPPSILNIFFVRQLPVPALVPNVLLGLLKTPHRKFLIGTFLGYLPSNGVVSLMGSAMGKEDAGKALWQVSAGMLGLAVVTFVIIVVRRRLEAAKKEESQ